MALNWKSPNGWTGRASDVLEVTSSHDYEFLKLQQASGGVLDLDNGLISIRLWAFHWRFFSLPVVGY
jgi:hypothetical protein